MLEQEIPTALRAEVYQFAHQVGSGQLLPPGGLVSISYLHLLTREGDVLGRLFAIFLQALLEKQRGMWHVHPAERAAHWLQQYCLNSSWNQQVVASASETCLPRPGAAWAEAIADFSLELGNGQLCPAILGGWDYVPVLMNYGVAAGERLALAFVIFTNVLRLDRRGLVCNSEQAQHRAAEYIRQLIDPKYKVQPAFQLQEVMRWL